MMMSKPFLVISLVVASLVVFTFSSCKDDNTYLSYNREVSTTKDFVIGQQMMVLILNTYFKSITDSVLLETGKSDIDGAKVYYSGEEFDTLLMRFPWWGTDDGYGHWRAGDIKVITNNGFYNTDAEYKFLFNDFYYDKDTIIVENLTMRYLGQEGQGDLFSFISDTIHQCFADSSGENMFWMYQQFLRIKDPSSNYYTEQDKFEIFGSFDGVSRSLIPYTTESVDETSLINIFNCAFLKQGPTTIDVSESVYQGQVYFSDPDTCANRYVVEFEGNPFPDAIYIREW